ncbi:hypothetical protein SFUMM280S_02143 [Streptomyces fumanus]
MRVVDGLLTGLHEPEASHLLMLEAVAGRAAVDRGYAAAVRGRYLWHEFGTCTCSSRRTLTQRIAAATDGERHPARVSPRIGRTSRTKGSRRATRPF